MTLQNTAILLLDTLNFTSRMNTPPLGYLLGEGGSVFTQRRLAFESRSFCYVTTGAESEQPVGAPFYQWVGCRDDAGLICFPHSGSW